MEPELCIHILHNIQVARPQKAGNLKFFKL
jgi:hypothetical protein